MRSILKKMVGTTRQLLACLLFLIVKWPCKGFQSVIPVRLQGFNLRSVRIHQSWDVEFINGDRREVIEVDEETSLLSAMEGLGVVQASECRRGNCLTCAGKLSPESTSNFKTSSISEVDHEEMETFLCDEAKSQGYLLTCCSFPTGPGLKIEANKNQEALEVQYVEQLTGLEAEDIRRRARAKAIMGYDITHKTLWLKGLEKQFEGYDSSSDENPADSLDLLKQEGNE
mmetsp:Transcript_12806/g.18901  ORF Transcript_12806/g.18901 Transcript_12806/m.18901 type:complete len:228 (-) Transcript_12806:205-888(-)